MPYCIRCHVKRKQFVNATKANLGFDYCLKCYQLVVEPQLQYVGWSSSENLRAVASRIRQAMAAAGVSGATLAEAIRVPESRITEFTRHEEGRALPRLPSLTKLVRICQVLKTTPNKILGFEDPELLRVREALGVLDYRYDDAPDDA